MRQRQQQPVKGHVVACMSWKESSKTSNLPGLIPVLVWSSLIHADQVVIFDNGSPIDSGRVDIVASDGSVLWLQADGAARRRLFLRRDATVYKRTAP